ncbi:MAG: ABC transporter permease, partial [Candidatus Methylomirabilota bacterium]
TTAMRSFVQALVRRKIALAGALVLLLILAMAILAPLVSPYDPMDLDPLVRLQGPSGTHWFGTDHFGRDIFSRVVYGARLTMVSGLGVVIYSVILGVLIGMLSGYFRRVGFVVMRLVDVVMSFPPLLLALALLAILGAGLSNVILAVGVTYLTRTSRIIFGLTLKLKEESFIEATRSLGSNSLRILSRHILPNLLSPVIVQATFTFAFSLLNMAALDFLGVGVPPQIPSWGNMISEGRVYITRAPGVLLFPGIFIVLTVLSFNLVGDVLRDKLDPRFRDQFSGVRR